MACFRGLTVVTRLRFRLTQEAATLGGVRWLQMQSMSDLYRLKKLNPEHGKVQLGNITMDMVLGGMRGLARMVWETSLHDPEENMTAISATTPF